MAQGLQCWDATGRMTFDTTTMTGRLIGQWTASAGSIRRETVQLSAGKRLWWFLYTQGDVRAYAYRDPSTQDPNEFTMQCDVGLGTGSGTAYFFWGEY